MSDERTKVNTTNNDTDQPTIEEFDATKSKLVAHAKHELDLAGISAKDSDYGGALAECAIELITTFAKQGHSGGSAEIVRQIFFKLSNFEPLSPITDNPKEWESVSKEFNEPMWQNTRSPALFSKDGGKTFMHVGTKKQGRSQRYVPEGKVVEKPKADS